MRSIALAVVAALLFGSAPDLTTYSQRRCGPHPCCAHGMCTMKQARFGLDRCRDEHSVAPPDEAIATAAPAEIVSDTVCPLVLRVTPDPLDGFAALIDRPPRA